MFLDLTRLDFWVVVVVAVAVGIGRDEIVTIFSVSERKRESVCGRLAKNEKALKMNREKKNRGKI